MAETHEPPTNGPAIRLEGVSKRFGDKVQALDDVSLEVPPGTVFGLLGPNGAGKTTAVRVLTTIITPDSGRATVLGRDVVTKADEVRAYQLPELHPAPRVQAGGGLVEEEDRRLMHQGRGQVEPAPHAARVGAGGTIAGVAQLEAFEQLVGATHESLALEVGEPPD